MRVFLVFWLLLTATVSLQAQQPSASPAAPPIKILFVGNSFTHGAYQPVRAYNAAAITDENFGIPADDPRAHHPFSDNISDGGIPGIFKKLTDGAGLNYEVHVEAVSAKDLAFHYEHALPIITRPDWDAVVLQGYSTEPLPVERGGKPERFLASALQLEKAIHAANPRAKVYLEETWPRADLVYPESGPYHGDSVDTMVTDLRAASQRVVDKGDFEHVVNVGDAWQRAIHEGIAVENPYATAEPGKLDLWGRDHYHPSIYGAYLSAVVLLCDVTPVSSTTLRPDEQVAHDLGISQMDAARLQRLGAIVVDTRASASAGSR